MEIKAQKLHTWLEFVDVIERAHWQMNLERIIERNRAEAERISFNLENLRRYKKNPIPYRKLK